MGLIYSTLLAASAENPELQTLITPMDWAITGYSWLMTYPHKLWGSEPIQGAISDTLMIHDLYARYIFPYVILGAIGLAYCGLPRFERTKELMAFQTRAQLDALVQQDPKHQARWAERWGLHGPQ